MWNAQKKLHRLAFKIANFAKYRGSASTSFRFPIKMLESITGVDSPETMCRAEDLSDEMLNYIYVLYIIEYYNSPVKAFEFSTQNVWGEITSSSDGIIEVTLHPLDIVLRVNVLNHDFDNIKIFGGIPIVHGDEELLSSLKVSIFNDIRTKIILRTGPTQQFNPNELFGFKIYIQEHYSGGGSSFDDAFMQRMPDGTKYLFWYNDRYSSINMQESVEFYRGTQNNKIGISFMMEEGELKIRQIRESNVPVGRVNEQYLDVVEAAMTTVSNLEVNVSGIHEFTENVFRANICWMQRYLPQIFEKFDTFIIPSGPEFQVQFIPDVLVELLYPGDHIDYGGIRKDFVTRLMHATLSPNRFVKIDDVDFVSTQFVQLPLGSSITVQESVTLSDFEKIIFRGLGSFIYYASKSSEHTHPIALGPILSSMFYKYICCHNHVDLLNIIVDNIGKHYEKQIMYLFNESYESIANLDDFTLKSNLEACIDAIDEDFIPIDIEWSDFWTEEKWTNAKSLLIRLFHSLYRKYTLPYDAIKSSIMSRSTITSMLNIPYIHDPIRIHLFVPNIPIGHQNVTFFTFDNATFQGEGREAALGVKYLILAAIYKYLGTSAPVILRSATDENVEPVRKWQAKVNVERLDLIRFYPNAYIHNFYYVKGAESVVELLSEKFKLRVQGELNRPKIVHEMQVNPILSNVKIWLTDFILHCTQEHLEKFLFFVTGSTRLLPGQHMKVKISDSSAINAHTCFNTIDIPTEYESQGSDVFISALTAIFAT